MKLAFANLQSVETYISTSLETFDGPNDELVVDREPPGCLQAVKAIVHACEQLQKRLYYTAFRHGERTLDRLSLYVRHVSLSTC